EVRYGQTVTSTGSTPVEKEGLMVTHHKITCQGQESARATFYWQPRN
ncbi:acyl-ACP thioesterase, partial [Limosilactobacillus fermentum]|nr:acyl-ACP thioesterase [Limosilactobacillus fermentum]